VSLEVLSSRSDRSDILSPAEEVDASRKSLTDDEAAHFYEA